MKIFDEAPADWRQLQDMVGQLFSEIGCEVAVGTTMPNVRGAKEIDVYARDPVVVPPSSYLCECKHWARAVSQETVHAFRTVMVDTGAHRGFIISSSGFQSGAREAAANTNIDLVTFDQLQAMFFDRWRVAMGERFVPLADKLFPYWDFPGRMPKFRWNRSHIERQQALMEAYQPIRHPGPAARMQSFRVQLPMTLPAVDERGMISGEVVLYSYRQMYDFMAANADVALYHFQVLHGEVPPKPGEYDPQA